jgi:hypothetical protein
MDERYYYYRDEHGRPVVTLARIKLASGAVAYGWAICSQNDNPCKRVGKNIALSRAEAALMGLNGFHMQCESAQVYVWGRAINRHEALSILENVEDGINLQCFLSSMVYNDDFLPTSMLINA